ncbi:MAG: BatA domain-containing protein [Verrucomicrobiota bacterium]
MTFLNFALLGGLAALSVPVLIHLFHKSRFQVVRWGAMHLLEDLLRTNQRRLKMEQIILLMLRASIPALLALCMARPVWKGMQALTGDAKTSAVILLDNSYSMDAGTGGTTGFSAARGEAAQAISALAPGSDAQVVLMAEGGSPLLDEPTYDLARLARALEKTDAGFSSVSVPAALNYAAGVLGRMHEPDRNLVVLTDFQRVSFGPDSDAQIGQAIDLLKKMPLSPSITFFDTGSGAKDNVAVESLEFPRLMVGVGQRFQIRANIRNFGDASYPDLRVYLKADGKEKSVSQIRLGPREKGQVLFTQAFDSPGSHIIELVADVADALKADNSFLASIPVRDRVPVLLVNGDPNTEPLKGETDFAEIALHPYGAAGKVEQADLIKTAVVTAGELTSRAIADSAVVMLANVRKLDDNQLRALQDFVRNGGGLFIFPGNRVDAAWYNSALHEGGKGLLPMPLGPIMGELKEGALPTGIVPQHFEHPALDLFSDPRNGSLGDAAIRLWFQLKEPASAEATTVLARLDSGDPFLAEKQFGQGHVIECAIPVDADWSNLPMRPSYLPLLQRLSVYLASTVFPPRNLDVGKPLVAFLPVSQAGKTAALVTPDGVALEIPIIKKGERGVVEFASTQRPGLYVLTPPGGPPLHYVVNTSRRESDLERLTDSEIHGFAKAHGVSLVRSGAEYRKLDHTRRFGMEIWRAILWVILVLLFLEIFLQQKFARARRTPANPARKP